MKRTDNSKSVLRLVATLSFLSLAACAESDPPMAAVPTPAPYSVMVPAAPVAFVSQPVAPPAPPARPSTLASR